MNRQLKFFIPLCAVLLSFSACKKDKEEEKKPDPTDTSVPVAKIQSPANNSVFTSGDTIWIKASTTDNDLHGVEITLTDDSDTAQLFYYKPHSHGLQSVAIDTFWKSNVTKNTNATLHFHTGDHAHNEFDTSHHITINK